MEIVRICSKLALGGSSKHVLVSRHDIQVLEPLSPIALSVGTISLFFSQQRHIEQDTRTERRSSMRTRGPRTPPTAPAHCPMLILNTYHFYACLDEFVSSVTRLQDMYAAIISGNSPLAQVRLAETEALLARMRALVGFLEGVLVARMRTPYDPWLPWGMWSDEELRPVIIELRYQCGRYVEAVLRIRFALDLKPRKIYRLRDSDINRWLLEIDTSETMSTTDFSTPS